MLSLETHGLSQWRPTWGMDPHNGAELLEFILLKDTVNTSGNLDKPSVSGLCFLCSSFHRIFVQKKSLESAQRQWHQEIVLKMKH